MAFDLTAAQGDGFASCAGPDPLYHAGTCGLSLSRARLPAKTPGKVPVLVCLLLVMPVTSVKDGSTLRHGDIYLLGTGRHDQTTSAEPSITNGMVIFSLTAKVKGMTRQT